MELAPDIDDQAPSTLLGLFDRPFDGGHASIMPMLAYLAAIRPSPSDINAHCRGSLGHRFITERYQAVILIPLRHQRSPREPARARTDIGQS
jgi:hypothetical protein